MEDRGGHFACAVPGIAQIRALSLLDALPFTVFTAP